MASEFQDEICWYKIDFNLHDMCVQQRTASTIRVQSVTYLYIKNDNIYICLHE